MIKNQRIECGKKSFWGQTVCYVYQISYYIGHYYELKIYDLLYIKEINKFVIKETTLDEDIKFNLWHDYGFPINSAGLEKACQVYMSYGIINTIGLEDGFKIHIYNERQLYETLYKEKIIEKKISKEEKKELDKQCETIVERIQAMSKHLIEKYM